MGWETSEARSCAPQLPAPGHGCLQPVNHFPDDDDDDYDEDDDDDNGDGYDDCRHLVTTAYNALSIFIAIWRITMITVDGIRNSELVSGPTRSFRTEKYSTAIC